MLIISSIRFMHEQMCMFVLFLKERANEKKVCLNAAYRFFLSSSYSSQLAVCNVVVMSFVCLSFGYLIPKLEIIDFSSLGLFYTQMFVKLKSLFHDVNR